MHTFESKQETLSSQGVDGEMLCVRSIQLSSISQRCKCNSRRPSFFLQFLDMTNRVNFERMSMEDIDSGYRLSMKDIDSGSAKLGEQ